MTILYHGTMSPEELIREEGLLVFTPQSLRDHLLRVAGTPGKLKSQLERALTSGLLKRGFSGAEPGVLCLTTSLEEAEHYISSPGELIDSVISLLPERLWFELESLIGVSGKIVVVDIPDEWLMDPRVRRLRSVEDESEEVQIPWDIEPQYIKEIIPM